MKLFRKPLKLPPVPNQITSSWVVGHGVFFYHGIDWLYLNEWWAKQPCVIYCN